MLFAKKKPDVLVVGAGPVGLTTALALTQRGVKTRIVDRGWRTGTRSYALALHAATLDLLDELDLLHPVLDRALRVRSVGIFDRSGRLGEVRIRDLPRDYSFLAVLGQEDFEKLLADELERRGVRVEWNHEVSRVLPGADAVTATIDTLDQDSVGYVVEHTEWVVTKSKEVQVPFVVGADGHRSRVRRDLGIEFQRIADPLDFAVFEFRTDADLGDEMRLAFVDGTTNVCWPLPEGFCRWSFQVGGLSPTADLREKDLDVVDLGPSRFPQLTQERLEQLLAERAPWFEGRVETIRWRVMVRFEARLAERFGTDHVWLAGDAGHTIGPAGVQSMNVGLREGCDLAAALAAALDGDAGALEAYDNARRAEWRALLGLEGRLRPGPGAPEWAARLADVLLPCLPASGADLARLAGQIGLEAPWLEAVTR